MEMTIVVAVLMIIAGLIVPNFLAIKRSRDARTTEANLLRFAMQVHIEAAKRNAPVRLRVDGEDLVMEQVPEGSANPQEIKRFNLDGELRVDSVQSVTQSAAANQGNTRLNVVDAGSWQWAVYPDGTADRGGVELTFGSVQKALVLNADGTAQLINGHLTDVSSDVWSAGQLSYRGQTSQ